MERRGLLWTEDVRGKFWKGLRRLVMTDRWERERDREMCKMCMKLWIISVIRKGKSPSEVWFKILILSFDAKYVTDFCYVDWFNNSISVWKLYILWLNYNLVWYLVSLYSNFEFDIAEGKICWIDTNIISIDNHSNYHH